MNVLIVRLSAIGDAIHGLPVLCALREYLPTARLTWVVEQHAAPIIEGHKDLDKLIVAPRRWWRSPTAILKLRRELRQFPQEVSIDLQGLTKSAAVGWLSGAALRIGFAKPEGREFSRSLNNRLIKTTASHVVDRYLQLLAPLGVNRPSVRFDVPRRPEDENTISSFIRKRGLTGGFVIVNPGAGWPSKRWPTERYAAVARYLGQQRHLQTVVVWAGAQERAWADQIITTAGGVAIMAPHTTLTELGELCRRARLFVGSDTGPLHLAAAVGAQCVGLYGPMPADRNGPYGEGHIAVQKMCLEGSSRARRTASDESMRAISVDDVTAASDQILDRQFTTWTAESVLPFFHDRTAAAA